MTGPGATSSIDACIFDVDGTLADTEDIHRRAFNRAFRDCGLDWHWDGEQYGALLAITGGKERISGYIDRSGLPPAARSHLKRRVAEIHGIKTRHYRALISGADVAPRPGIRALLLAARAAGLRLAIASTTSPDNIEPLLQGAFGPQACDWFDVVVTGDAVARKKPAPDVYQATLAALRLPAARAIAFEDSAIGVQSAKAAGIFTVATPNRWTESQDFILADVVCGAGRREHRGGAPPSPGALECASLDLETLALRHAAAGRHNAEHGHGRS